MGLERLDGWDWNGFASTLIATLVGALLGLVGVWFGFRWQKSQRYNEILDDCIVRVLEQIAVHATALSAFQEQRDFVAEYERGGVSLFERTGERALSGLADFAMSINLDIAQMRARGDDQLIVTEAIRAHDRIRLEKNLRVRKSMLGLLGGALSRWRSQIWPVSKVRESIARVSAVADPMDFEVP